MLGVHMELEQSLFPQPDWKSVSFVENWAEYSMGIVSIVGND